MKHTNNKKPSDADETSPGKSTFHKTHDADVITPARVRWTAAQLRAAKLHEQGVIDALDALARPLTTVETERVLLALRRLRRIAAVQALYRGLRS